MALFLLSVQRSEDLILLGGPFIDHCILKLVSSDWVPYPKVCTCEEQVSSPSSKINNLSRFWVSGLDHRSHHQAAKA